jgi:hypothetical protein
MSKNNLAVLAVPIQRGDHLTSPPLYKSGEVVVGGQDQKQVRRGWLTERVEHSRRAARLDTCPRCNAPILTGPDHDTCARVARVDTTPVDRLHEIAALLTGRHSYNLVRGELHYREPHHIHSANQAEPIHLNHQCTDGGTLW